MNNYYNYVNRANNSYEQSNLFDPYQGFIRGNLFKNLYSPYRIEKPFEVEPVNEQAKMLTAIDALKFSMIDLNLYLDVYPNNQEGIELFNRYRVQKDALCKEYESKYGPLNLNSDALMSFPWAWARTPWPWES